MNKPTFIVACAAAFIGMGIAMPQCPGDKAMQQQIDGLRQSQQSMTTKLIAVDGQARNLQAEVGQTKQLVTQLASAVVAQKDAIDRMNKAMTDLQTKVVELEKRPVPHSKSRSKSKSRTHKKHR